MIKKLQSQHMLKVSKVYIYNSEKNLMLGKVNILSSSITMNKSIVFNEGHLGI